MEYCLCTGISTVYTIARWNLHTIFNVQPHNVLTLMKLMELHLIFVDSVHITKKEDRRQSQAGILFAMSYV